MNVQLKEQLCDKVLIEDEGEDSFSDTLVELGVINLSQDQLRLIFKSLPDDIIYDAVQWGIDTVVRDSIYTYLSDNPHLIGRVVL